MKYVKIIANIGYAFLSILMILLVSQIVLSRTNIPGGLRMFIVQSGSMEPAIKTGALAFTKEKDAYGEGEIISFLAKPDTKMGRETPNVMHRIVGIEKYDGITSYITKGDANQANDPDFVSKPMVLGKVLFTIPYLGYIASFAKSVFGFLLLIVLPGLLLIISELISIKKEVFQILGKKKNKDLIQLSKKKTAKIVSALIITLMIISVTALSANALFFDTENSSAVISTGRWGGQAELVCEFTGDRNTFHYGIFNHGGQYSSFSYLLTYETNGLTQSAQGNDIALGEVHEEDIYLGTCSDTDCTPDPDPNDLEFAVTLDGQKQLGCRWMWQENQWREF